MKVFLTAPAEADLEQIGDWIGRDSTVAALRFVDRLYRACSALTHLTLRHPIDPRTGLRKLIEGDYLIFYRVTDQVEIVRIIHGARDWLGLLADDDG